MFGAIVASRPVITTLQTVSPTQFAFNIPSNPPFSHLVVFLLPSQTLAEGTAAAIYIQIPPSNEFRLLGAIANEKQSAIFKMNASTSSAAGANSTTTNGVQDDIMIDDATLQPTTDSSGGPDVIVGISVEPVADIEGQLATLKSGRRTHTGTEVVPFQQRQSQSVATQRQFRPDELRFLAQRIIKNAFNFLLSFARGPPGQEIVPLNVFQDWWTKFEKRVELEPAWLEKHDVEEERFGAGFRSL